VQWGGPTLGPPLALRPGLEAELTLTKEPADTAPMPSKVTKIVVAMVTIAALCCAAVAQASPARFEGISKDGSIALFSTSESMVKGDTDTREDIYVRSFDSDVGEYVTREVSIGPIGGNDAYNAVFRSVSGDGTKVIFATQERLTPDDQDHSQDIYLRDLSDNTTTLVSQGDASCASEGCGKGEYAASFAPGGTAANGTKVFFVTAERLSSDDDDSAFDIYVRDLSANSTTLVSAGDPSCSASSCGNGEFADVFETASSDGTKAVFTTSEGLVDSDTDGEADIYERDVETGTTTLVTPSGTCPDGLDCRPTFGGASSDGGHVFFETNDRLVAGDTDERSDVYDWNGGTPTQVSTASGAGNGTYNAIFAGSSADGDVVYFETSEQLDPADTDSVQDVYSRSGGGTSLISTGPAGGNGPAGAEFRWASPDDSTSGVIFSTAEALTSGDTDEAQDLYMREGGTTTLLSTGPEGGNGTADALFSKASDDGSRVFFTTTESLVAEDADSSGDVYERSGTSTALISNGIVGGNGPFGVLLNAVSANGSRAFFSTLERLTSDDDFTGEEDVYSHSGGGTLLVSVRNNPDLELGPPAPTLTKTSPASPGESTEPRVIGQAASGTTVKIYTNPQCSEAPVATGSSTLLASPGLQVTVAPGSSTTFWATAEGDGIISPCSSSSVTYRQETATPPPPPPPPPPPTPEPTPEPTPAPTTGTKSGNQKGGGTRRGSATNGAITFVAPETQVTFGPSFKTRKHRPVFRFIDATGQPGTTFHCRVDRRRWAACSSPFKLPKLGDGRHLLRVKGMNALGVWEAAPSKRRFQVVGR
jgi:Tol biopolymer transport system component